jgi:hypothetical protein
MSEPGTPLLTTGIGAPKFVERQQVGTEDHQDSRREPVVPCSKQLPETGSLKPHLDEAPHDQHGSGTLSV